VLVLQEVFVAVGAGFHSLGDFAKAVQVQLPLKGTVLLVPEVFHEDVSDKDLSKREAEIAQFSRE
jgi:hypothetical protein